MLLDSGCKKAPSGETAQTGSTNAVAASVPQSETIFRLRWLGTRRLLAETNAAGFATLWNLPETGQVQTQTLDRLALFLTGATDFTNVAGAVTATNISPWRPILDDLMSEESYWEIQQVRGKPGNLALAIRLSDERAKVWQASLTKLLGAMAPAASSGDTNAGQWQLTNWPGGLANGMAAPRTLELSRAGAWTVVGLAAGSNTLTRQFAGRVEAQTLPAYLGGTNFWIKADLNATRIDEAMALGWKLPADLPAASLDVIGDGDGVRSHAQLDFPKSLPDKLEPWNIPTNIVHDPLNSFTAMRGVGSWLSSLELWKSLGVGPAPDQLYFWSQSGLPFIGYCAAPFPNASNALEGLTIDLLKANPWIDTNGLGRFEQTTNCCGVIWSNLTIVTPFLQLVSLPQGGFVYGGLEADVRTNHLAPPELLGALFTRPNLVAYDWEMTGPRVEQWLYFGQFLRFALHLAQVPPKSASFAWLNALTPHLGNSVTMVTKTGPNQLAVGRKSDMGLTSAELDLLADWLESPKFPHGLNTYLGQPAPLPPKFPGRGPGHSHTNSAPAPKP